MRRVAQWSLIWLATIAVVYAGPYSEQLRTDSPQSGRFIAEDGSSINIADDVRCSLLNIARGLCDGATPFGSYGERTVTGAESNVPVWPDGDIVFTPQIGVQMSVQSSSTNDTAGGANIRSIEIHYLDRKLNSHNEIVELNGTSSVLTVATDIRWVQCAHIDTFGSDPTADGNITITYGGNIYSYISAGENRCSSSFRMVPGGVHLYIDGAVGGSVSSTADTKTKLKLVATELEGRQYETTPVMLIPIASIGLQNGSISFNFPPGIRYSPGTIVGCSHTTDKAAIVSCSWFGHLEPIQ